MYVNFGEVSSLVCRCFASGISIIRTAVLLVDFIVYVTCLCGVSSIGFSALAWEGCKRGVRWSGIFLFDWVVTGKMKV